jgi:hypothetical protein
MMKNSKYKFLVLGAMAVLGGASLSHADTIEATTSGVVNPTTVDGVTITFTGTTLSTNTPETVLPLPTFGTFDVSGIGPDVASFSSDFTLTITQTDPSNDSGDIAGTITGAVEYFSNTLHLDVTGGSLVLAGGPGAPGEVIPNVTYTLMGGNIGNNIGDVSSFDASVYGSINFIEAIPAVPVPASALGGSALLGLIGAVKVRGSRKVS